MSFQEKFLSDYTPSAYSLLSVHLVFSIEEWYTIVENTLEIVNNFSEIWTLILNGVNLELLDITLDGKSMCFGDDYILDDEKLTLPNFPSRATLFIKNKIFPEKNTELEWLYKASWLYCTQNEPEWFRKITYFLDRPDVMTVYTTKIIASKKYPILLSNGNLIDSGDIDEERHFSIWHDPFKKPSYLFALVAWDLGKISDTFITSSGKKVDLHIFSEHGNEKKCLHALESLKKAMKWDEDTYGREYDLDVFHIVATDSFNMGAMENKSLNIFNTIYVLADLETATDRDFLWVEAVIAHEYFHNWTGDRITCRDWFQLTLKEGLTVFRDHDFSGDMNSRATMRIEDIRDLREFQFPEDAGPTAHPIQPASYKEMNNFYTATVYEKGSEVIRMMATLLGKEAFRKAMDLYFDTFDGQAVRTQDFVWAMATAGNIDLTQFEEAWYHQERTPSLKVTGVFDPTNQTYTLECEQIIDKNTKWESQKPFFYPFRVALLNPTSGKEMVLVLKNNILQSRLSEWILIISKEKESFVFENISTEPKISLNRGFSAPIRVISHQRDGVFLVRNETDGFARYEALEQLTLAEVFRIASGSNVSETFLKLYGDLLIHSDDPLYQALLIQIPSLNTITQNSIDPIDFSGLSNARNILIQAILDRFEDRIITLYELLFSELPKNEGTTPVEIALRSYIVNLLTLLSSSQKKENIQKMAEIQYQNTRTMTLRLSSLSLLNALFPKWDHPYIQEFIEKYIDNPLVIMKYFSLVWSNECDWVVENIQNIQKKPYYQESLPNHAKALFGAFTRNLAYFHNKDGSGYNLLTEFILKIDSINPHTAARMAWAFKIFPKLSIDGQMVMRPFLQKIQSHEGLSKNTEEIIEKILSV